MSRPPLLARPALDVPDRAAPTFGGYPAFRGPLGDRVRANQQNWLLTAPDANPAMLQIFRDRDRTPSRDLLPWSGEFAGKYLISATQALRLTRDRTLRGRVAAFVRDLIATQRADGYLGPFPAAEGMTGPGRWDLWGQYHVMLGLLDWHRLTGDRDALASCRRGADHFCDTFLGGTKRVVQAGSEEMNESSIHVFTLLYQETGETRYLRLVREIEKDWQTPPSGDYVRAALAGKAFYQTAKPRWESLPSIQAIGELYYLTGEARYRQAFTHLWWSIVEGDRHNTGGFSSGEQATGNPYDPRPIETCCTVAWMALTVDYLRLTGDPRAADELELSTWNATLGAQHPSGRWWTYNTPMDGERRASAHEIVFQARAGSPELNCCSVNGPRSLGMLAEWSVMAAGDGVALNFYGPCSLKAFLPSGRGVRFEQQTDYPKTGHVHIAVTPDAPSERFVLRLRIPGWAKGTRVTVNGDAQSGVQAGACLALDRAWERGDVITLDLDMSPWLWVGEREAAGKVSVYHGPLLLAYDPRFDAHDPTRLPPLQDLSSPAAVRGEDASTLVRLRFPAAGGRGVTLCDFASAGAAGNPYISWLPVTPGRKPVPFTRGNPLRMALP